LNIYEKICVSTGKNQYLREKINIYRKKSVSTRKIVYQCDIFKQNKPILIKKQENICLIEKKKAVILNGIGKKAENVPKLRVQTSVRRF